MDETNNFDEQPTRPIGGTGPDDATTPRRAAASGPLLGGRYEVGGLLGRGGMAEVRQAYDTRLGRPVAVKQLRSDLATDPTFQARFRREAQSAAGLNHPNIVSVYDTGEELNADGVAVPYIVMELVEGQTLRDILRDDRKILPERALEITQGVLDALAYSHKNGIVHRDIKPANVMLTPTGQVKVMDFGIARAVADTSATMTQTAAVIGTAQYLSPEQARGETVDNRSDIYSAGCVLYELLTGRPPFIGDSPVSVAYQHVREQPVPPSQFDPLVTPDVDTITLKALSKDPADRYQDAREMRDDISRVLAGEGATAVLPAPSPAPDADATRLNPAVVETETVEDEEEPKKSRRVPIIIGILAALVLAGLVAGYFLLRPAPAPAQVAVPALNDFTPQAAEAQLRNVGLNSRIETERGADDNTVGRVIGQDPPEGTMVNPGSTVTLTVNEGPEKAEIPAGLVGSSRDEARKALEDAGFSNISEEADDSSDAPENEVLSVSPASGQSVPVSDSVTLRYSSGSVEIPNWVGSTRERVEADARDLDLRIDWQTETTSDQPPGLVTRSDPGAGKSAKRGDTVTVWRAEAPQPTQPTDQAPDPSPSESDEPSEPEPTGSAGPPTSEPTE
ncbi:serine/threonine-protein kinase [Naumannella cuiyingiana]|uniref:non-specific serine/threonine protein kinase n=1 Tax=Naumannella cuiyingiana TaxID=1347891 RepID=A0A7Z0IL57_9ACTN|nr:Stk1 family PASTA domain-containing Ser/Thr kinase [Naumannella cuiyingiana]NYI71226.1 serine/threonine-protein kinase [Naumannella cuiyingiana]